MRIEDYKKLDEEDLKKELEKSRGQKKVLLNLLLTE